MPKKRFSPERIIAKLPEVAAVRPIRHLARVSRRSPRPVHAGLSARQVAERTVPE